MYRLASRTTVKSSTGDDKIVKKNISNIHFSRRFYCCCCYYCIFFICSFKISIHLNCVCSPCRKKNYWAARAIAAVAITRQRVRKNCLNFAFNLPDTRHIICVCVSVCMDVCAHGPTPFTCNFNSPSSFSGKLIIDLFHSFDIISMNGPLNFQLDFQLFV